MVHLVSKFMVKYFPVYFLFWNLLCSPPNSPPFWLRGAIAPPAGNSANVMYAGRIAEVGAPW